MNSADVVADSTRFAGRGTVAMIAGWVGSLLVLPAVLIAVVLPMPWSVAISLIVVLSAGCIVARAWRISLEVTPERVIIVNFFRRYDLPWEEIQGVAVGAGSILASWGDGINVSLRRDKRMILCQASVSSEEQRLAMLDALRTHAEPWAIPVRARDW